MSPPDRRQAGPYLGLDPFEPADSDYFFGREREQRVIIANLLSAPLTILYGAAAVGKSSLLMAGVMPQLQRDQPRTPVVMFRDWRGPDFARRLAHACVQTTWAIGVDQPRPAVDLPLDEVLRACAEAAHGTVIVLLDQFEDYLALHPKSADPESFEAQFARAVNRDEVDVGFLVAVREASLSRLDRFRERIPNLLGNRLRLRHLDARGAELAIREPVRVWNDRHAGAQPVVLEDDLAAAVVKQVRAGGLRPGLGRGKSAEAVQEESIEAAFLQLVMERLWKEDSASGVLTQATLERLGGAQGIVRAHLNDTLAGLDAPTQAVCASFFDRLVTPSGDKVACALQDLAGWAGERSDLVAPALESLSAKRVLRTVAAVRDTAQDPRYEIFSDVLAPAVLDWHARYVETQRRERAVTAAREQARRRARQFWTYGLAAALLVAAIGWLGAFREGRRAQANQLMAEANQWAAESRNAARTDALLAVQRALEAVDHRLPAGPTEPVVDALRLAVQGSAATVWTQPMPDRVTSVALSPDGRFVAAGMLDRKSGRATVEVRDSATGALAGPHASFVVPAARSAGAVAWLPGGGLAAALGKVVYVWPGSDLSMPPRTLDHGDHINTALALSGDGRWLATGGGANGSRTIKIWDLKAAGSEPASQIPVQQGWLFGLAFSPDGCCIAGASVDPIDTERHHVGVWHIGTQRLALTVPMPTGSDSVAFTPDGKRLVSSGRDSRVYVWSDIDARLAQPGAGSLSPWTPRILAGHDERVRQVSVSSDGSRIASAGGDGNIKLWDAHTFANVTTLDAHDSYVEATAFGPDGARLVSGGLDRRLRMWNIGRHTAAVNHVAFGASGLASASNDGSVRLWDLSSGMPRQKLVLTDATLQAGESHSDAVYRLAFFSGADGERLASASFDRRVKVWDPRSGALLRNLGGHTDQLRDLAVSADGSYLASAGADGWALLHSLTSSETMPLALKVREQHQVYAVAIHSDARQRWWVTGAEEPSQVQLWDFAGQAQGAIALGATPVAIVSIDGGDSLAVLAGRTLYRITLAGLRRSDASSMQQMQISGARRCRALAHAPATRRLAVGCANGTIYVFDAGATQPSQTINVHEGEVMGLAFSSDGKALASASADHALVVSPLDTNELIELARRRWVALNVSR